MNIIDKVYQSFCEERFPLPSEKQIADLERRMRIAFPPDYRRFLLQYNGGFFNEPDISPPSEDCPLDGLAFLSGIGATLPVAELTWPCRLGLFDDNDPPQILPIGYTLMGNLLFLVTDPDPVDYGGIGLKIAFSSRAFSLGSGIEEFFRLLRDPRSGDTAGQ